METVINDLQLNFETHPDLFSPNAVDMGTRAMLSVYAFNESDKVLDLGCGYGVVGIYAARLIGGERVTMCDISETALQYAGLNAEKNNVTDVSIIRSDGLENIYEEDYTVILSNPPYHTDFSVAKHFIEDGYKRLKPGGHMVMVTKRLTWYKNKLTSVFGGVKVHEADDYYVFVAEKKPYQNRPVQRKTNTLSKKLQRKYHKNLSSDSRR